MKIVFTAIPVKNKPGRHHMTMEIDGGKVVNKGINRLGQTAKQAVDEFRVKFPDTQITLIDRTVQ
jgi:hypothetical protein